MADYDLDRLGSSEFEQLVQALLVKYLGPSVKVFGRGRDGGRDATADYKLLMPDGTAWSGYSVVQVKHRGRPGTPDDNAKWLQRVVEEELIAWLNRGTSIHGNPTNFLLVTNVSLSAVPGHGSDSVEKIFNKYSTLMPLDHAEIWAYDKVCRLLDGAEDVRKAYAGLITPGDVLSRLYEVSNDLHVDMGEVIRRHAEKELTAEQWIRLGQAGSKVNEKLTIAQVAIDLPIERSDTFSTAGNSAAAVIIRTGNRVLRPSIIGRGKQQPHIVLVGGPGQGKTTISQLVSQAYRLALLEDKPRLASGVADNLADLRSALVSIKVPMPAARRWPLRIELSSYAECLSTASGTSLLRYIAKKLSDRLDEPVRVSELRKWLNSWPWILFLDGLDEVSIAPLRDLLMERLSEFQIEAENADADLLIVATTRPRGYAGEFGSNHYAHVTLADLSPQIALVYAAKLLDARHRDDPDMLERVKKYIRQAAEVEITARLMRTPLQVTIMSLLLESRARVPQQRHALFDAYYQTIYAREVAKPTDVAPLLDQHRSTVDRLHDIVGLAVQLAAESSDHIDPAIPYQRLVELTDDLLRTDEYSKTEALELRNKILRATTERLVLLVPKNDGDVGFEVRSLQEFLAARALTRGPDGLVIARLRAAAPSVFWRNTWLLGAGRVAEYRPHLIDSVIGILDDLDSENYLMLQIGVGSELAVDLLDDDFGAPSPRVRRLLVKKAIEAIRLPVAASTIPTAQALQRAALTNTEASTMIRNVAVQALSGLPPPRITAAVMLRRWALATENSALSSTAVLAVPRLSDALNPADSEALSSHFLGIARPRKVKTRPRFELISAGTLGAQISGKRTGLQGADLDALKRLVRALDRVEIKAIRTVGRNVLVVPEMIVPDQRTLEHTLSRPAIADLLAEVLADLSPQSWAVASALAHVAVQWVQHREVASSIVAARHASHA